MTPWRWALLAVAIRAGFVVTALLADPGGRLSHADPDGYLRHAEALAKTGRFALEGAPELFRTPGYPVLLVPAVLSGHAHVVVIGLQLAAAALTVLLIRRLASAVTGDNRAADAAAVLACVDPVLVVWTTVPMTETVFTAATTAALLALRRAYRMPSTRDAVALGALIAASAYIRPIAYGLGLIVPVTLGAFGSGPRGPRLRAASIACAAFLLAVAPWHARNWHAAGYSGFSTLLDRAIYLSAGAAVAAHEQGRSFTALREARRADARDTWTVAHDVAPDYARFRSQGLAEVGRAPLLYATIHLSGIVRVLLDPGAVEYFRFLGRYPESGGLLAVAHEGGLVTAMNALARAYPGLFLVTLALGAWLVITSAAAAWGVVRLWHGGQRADVWLLVGGAAYFLVLSGGAHGISRFRHPIVPVLCVFAGACVSGSGKIRSPVRRFAPLRYVRPGVVQGDARGARGGPTS